MVLRHSERGMARLYQGVIRRRWHRRVGGVVQELVELRLRDAVVVVRIHALEHAAYLLFRVAFRRRGLEELR